MNCPSCGQPVTQVAVQRVEYRWASGIVPNPDNPDEFTFYEFDLDYAEHYVTHEPDCGDTLNAKVDGALGIIRLAP
jgi:hypothetical protein